MYKIFKNTIKFNRYRLYVLLSSKSLLQQLKQIRYTLVLCSTLRKFSVLGKPLFKFNKVITQLRQQLCNLNNYIIHNNRIRENLTIQQITIVKKYLKKKRSYNRQRHYSFTLYAKKCDAFPVI
jgi:hypothetical protein